AVRGGSGEDVVLVRHVADAVHDRLLLGERELLAERVADPRLLDRVPVELGDTLAHALTAGVVPRSVADAVTRVDRARALRAEVRGPADGRPAARRGAELLAVRVGACEAAVVRPVALPDARDEERHRLRGCRRAPLAAACGSLSREPDVRTEHE